jgi:hypothetical protein
VRPELQHPLNPPDARARWAFTTTGSLEPHRGRARRKIERAYRVGPRANSSDNGSEDNAVLKVPVRLVVCAILCATMSGCAAGGAASAPSPLPLPKVVATPQQDRVTVVAVQTKPVGDILPVYVSIANGTSEPILESQGEIFVFGEDGNRVPAVPLEEATAQAGGAAGLVSSVETAAAYGIPAAANGATGGAAMLGTVLSGGSWESALTGTIIGSAMGLLSGTTDGLRQAHTAAEQRAKEQIRILTLRAVTVPPDGTASGYVFYPIGEYQNIEAVVGFTESRTSASVKNQLQ